MALPVVLFLTADLEAVIQREGPVSIPVGQLHPENVLPLAGQLINKLVPQPVFGGHASKALKEHHIAQIRRLVSGLSLNITV